VLDGTAQRSRVAFERGDDDLIAVRTLGDQVRECPRDTLCLDYGGLLRTTLFGYMDTESGAGLGFQSAIGHSGISLALTQNGPEAAIVLPLGRWLGIYRWLPIEAELSVSTDRFYFGPILRKGRCTQERNPEQTSARQQLPFGLGSRCVLRAE
jgi:hypothetical protein